MTHLYAIAMLILSVAVLAAVLVSFHTLYEGTCLTNETVRNKLTIGKFPTKDDLKRFKEANKQEVRAKLDRWLRVFREQFTKAQTHTGYAVNHATPSAVASKHI